VTWFVDGGEVIR